MDVPENKKKFLDKIAQKHKFDPLVAENWKSVSIKSISRDSVNSLLSLSFLFYFNYYSFVERKESFAILRWVSCKGTYGRVFVFKNIAFEELSLLGTNTFYNTYK